jgi:2-amino-4-hydroxy-6-hydroxymethyldihydropteridine diphosphokinase
MTSASTSADPRTVVIALGSNLGDREYHLRAALHDLRAFVRIVRVSAFRETEPVDAPPPNYLNAVAAGYTYLQAEELLSAMLVIERAHGRVRRGVRNAPRPLDLDLIRYSGALTRTPRLTVPHPRYRAREFVMGPMRELGLV